MTFELKADESVARGVRRLLRGEIDKAEQALTGTGDGDDSPVHDARKRFKKVRAVLKLARAALGEREYQCANARFRNAGRPLTEVRDAEVLVEALDGLKKRFGPEVAPGPFDCARQLLLARREETARRVLQEENALQTIADAVRKERRLGRLALGRKGWAALEGGLEDTYTRGRDGLALAEAAPTVENLHEWRKRVKDLRHQLEALSPARPGTLSELAEQLHDLGDLLGDDHDLAVLRRTLAETDADPDQALPPLLDRRRGELQRRALDLGRTLFRDPVETFTARLAGFWKAWRWASRAAGKA
jgi:CHAD domain-containing protein